ncbi:PaaI family thioesterase, partial [Sphingomonas sp.]|uniref:PaaI family thioesterase n=1 Tax=Sphingomonas sp. TaxID=28214 RepID=UPI00286C781B
MTEPASTGVADNGGTFDPVGFFKVLQHHGHAGLLGMRYESNGEDWVEISLPWREELVGVPEAGLLASGAVISLIDLAGGVSVWLKRGKFVADATLDLRIDYLRPSLKGQKLYARCRCIKLTRQIAFVEGFAHVG